MTLILNTIIVIYSFQTCQSIHNDVVKYLRSANVYTCINSVGITSRTRSAIDCCKACSKQMGCSSTNYNRQSQTCELLTAHPTQYGLIYVSSNDWNVYYKTGICADQWVLYRNRCYFFDMNNRTWDETREFCSLNDADLVEISDAEENNMVYQNAQSKGLDYYWIGLTDAEDERNFQWLSGEPVPFTYFIEREPNVAAWDEDCIATIRGDSLSFFNSLRIK